jgi:hypothetical protein
MYNDRNAWPYDCNDALKELTARGIGLPARVADAVDVLRRVEAAKPVDVSPTALREAFTAGASPAELDRLLLADLGSARLKSEWTQAVTDCAGSVLAAIRASSDEIMPALRADAENQIAKLTRVAGLGDARLDALVRENRHEDARERADADLTAAALDRAYRFRDNYLTRGGGTKLTINGINASRWRDPQAAAAQARGDTPAQQYVSGIAAGLSPWFPSPTEAIEAAQEIANRIAAVQKRNAQADHGLGSYAAFS